MKYKMITMLAVSAFLVACSSSKSVDSVSYKEYGPAKVDEKKAMDVVTMLKDFSSKNGAETEYTVEAKISQVCAKAGCWINIDKGNGETFMVRFKDHFTIPTNTAPGTMAILHGSAYMDTVSVDMLRHFAEDAGDSPEEIEKITEPQYNLGFEADAIRLLPAPKKEK